MSRRPTIASLQTSLTQLSPDEQRQLYDWLGEQLQEHAVRESNLRQGAVEKLAARLSTPNYEGKTYVAQKRRCGKIACACMDGDLSEVGHGPYWYAYWNEDGKTQSEYIGKRPPWQEE